MRRVSYNDRWAMVVKRVQNAFDRVAQNQELCFSERGRKIIDIPLQLAKIDEPERARQW